jgi:preprotein translocase subunit SecD
LLEFYETYNHKSLNELLKGDSTLANLVHQKTSRESSAEIGCITASEMKSVNDYLNGAGLHEKCRFAWSDLFDDSEVCLYALRTADSNRIPLTGADFQSIESYKDTTSQNNLLAFTFKEPAIQIWADVTKRNLHKAVAFMMDNKVMFAPVVVSEITGGRCTLSGDFTQTQLRYIAAIGANGMLPESFSIIR